MRVTTIDNMCFNGIKIWDRSRSGGRPQFFSKDTFRETGVQEDYYYEILKGFCGTPRCATILRMSRQADFFSQQELLTCR